MTLFSTTLSTSSRPALLDSHTASCREQRSRCFPMKRSCIGAWSGSLCNPAGPRSQARPRSGSVSRAATGDASDGSEPKNGAKDTTQSAEVQAWDSMTDRLVGATSIPFSILVLPQAYTNYMNMAAGNAAALSILSWEVGFNGCKTSTLHNLCRIYYCDLWTCPSESVARGP